MRRLNILSIVPIILVGGLLLLIPMEQTQGQHMRENASRSLFSDRKAFHVGDAVTVLIVESSSASNDSRTTTSRRSDVSMGASGRLPDDSSSELGFSMGSANQFRGEGTAQSRGSVRAQVAVRVEEVYPNGDLFINGMRTIMVNNQKQVIRISGLVRPEDIRADNTVFSHAISDATIIFEDTGSVYRTRKPGLLTRFFHWLF